MAERLSAKTNHYKAKSGRPVNGLRCRWALALGLTGNHSVELLGWSRGGSEELSDNLRAQGPLGLVRMTVGQSFIQGIAFLVLSCSVSMRDGEKISS